jgi:hypothetical protein
LPELLYHQSHWPLWAWAAEDAKQLLREKRLSELQRAALRRDIERIEAVLEKVTPPLNRDAPSPKANAKN